MIVATHIIALFFGAILGFMHGGSIAGKGDPGAMSLMLILPIVYGVIAFFISLLFSRKVLEQVIGYKETQIDLTEENLSSSKKILFWILLVLLFPAAIIGIIYALM